MSSLSLRRTVAIVTSALLAVLLVGPAGVSARDTRALYVGDPADYAIPLPTDYVVRPTPVSEGNVTYFDVLIKNAGKQTLTSATVGMGTLIGDIDGVAGPRLPEGWKIKNVVSLSGIAPTCITDLVSTAPATGLIEVGAYVGFNCNFGNLAKGSAGGTIRVYLIAGPALPGGSAALVVSGKVAEAVGGNVGSNANTFFAYGTGDFFVSGAGKVAGLFTGGTVTPKTHGGPATTIDLGTLSDDYVVSIDETSGPACLSTVPTCLTGVSTAHVNFGNAVSPYFVWTILFPVDASYKLSNKTGFIHYFDTYTATGIHSNDYEIFYNTKRDSCSTTRLTIPCADFTLIVDPITKDPLFVQVRFLTNENGSGRAF